MHPPAPLQALLPTTLLALAALAGCGGASAPDPGTAPAAIPASEGGQEAPPDGPPTDEDPRPGRRRAVNGLAGFQSRSSLTFVQPGVESYRLDTTYVFPDRARWRQEPEKRPGDRSARRMHFRSGTELWLVREREDASIAFLGEEKRRATLQIELRRVAMTWPAELEWRGPDERRRAELPGLGILVAELDPETKRPRAIESRLTEEEVYERLEEIEWQTIQRRHWPASWTLSSGGKPIWRETFVEIIAGGRFLDSFFRPPDRREPAEGSMTAPPQRVELPPRAVRIHALEAGASWEQALAAADRELTLWKEKLEGKGLRLDERLGFRLSERGRPIAVELRLAEPPEVLPEGWKQLEGGDGLTVLQAGLAGLESNALPSLRGQVPEGSRAGTPYALVQREEGGIQRVQVVLPLVGGE